MLNLLFINVTAEEEVITIPGLFSRVFLSQEFMKNWWRW
jgi:hypothetical protein